MNANAPHPSISDDTWLGLPLEGVRLIEASAGTGKTFTLATLVTRLVVERGLRLAQVLTVTFTEAATQELRARIRQRLHLAWSLVGSDVAEDESAETTLTRAVLDSHLARSGESEVDLRQRLRQAIDEIDLAAIFTIHGFCARVLRENALESGQGFDPPELLANDRALRDEIAADLWRAHARDADSVDDLLALWKEGPDALSADLPALLREPVLLPPHAPVPHSPSAALEAARRALDDAIANHIDDARALVTDAFDRKILHGSRAKRPSFEKAFAELESGRNAGNWPRSDKTHVGKLLPQTLATLCYDDKREQAPQSPLFDALQAWVDADDAMRGWLALRRAHLLHRVRDDARLRIAGLKRRRRVQTYDDLIDGVADALDGPQGDALARQMREQYRVALVDEFQDTDPRQWQIFDRVFGAGNHAPALFLVGDPKQAIYGFRGGDVHTYLAARASADQAPPLAQNFRSRPSLLSAVDALYANAGDTAFIDGNIRFHPVQPGGKRRDEDFLREGASAPALTVWQAPEPGTRTAKGEAKPWSAGASRDLATAACVAAIHQVLSDARAGRAMIDGNPVRPGDIAVLVRSHAEATRIQRALGDVGIPAVAAGKLSLFASPEARELHVLLLALLHGADDGRLRAALSTVLVGVDAAGIDALDRDANTHRDCQYRALGWRDRLLRGGPLALVGDLCASGSERLLGLVDGERRVTNYLQLAELLQEAQARALGLQGLVDWLGRRIATADANDETQLLRLESDARRVQIVTLHKSKGLEYPLVFLPFVGIGRPPKSPSRHCTVHGSDQEGRRLHWQLDLPASGWSDAASRWKEDQRAEDARLLYVGLTRAEHALWIASGLFHAHDKSSLHPMLGSDDARKALAVLPGVHFDTTPPPADLPRLLPASVAAVPAPRRVTRALSHDWWVYSFTQLAHAPGGGEGGNDPSSAATLPAPGGQDEPLPVADDEDMAFDPRFAGARFGVALHDALEHSGFAAWQDWRPGDDAPVAQAEVITRALRQEGYADDEIDDGLALATALVGHTLTVVLPEGRRLCDVPEHERRAEIEFQFAVQPTRVDALLQLLHAHGIVRERQGFGLRQRLEGLMTGLIDLTYTVDGRWYVLDYKSNRLPRYDAASLQDAMAHGEYDLQALIYTLALHRWLRFRLADGYDYARDFGGIRYLFCRGLDAARDDSPGIHAQRFHPDLVHALDALFGHASGEVAA